MDKEAETCERLIWSTLYSESVWPGIVNNFQPEKYIFLGLKKKKEKKTTNENKTQPTQDYFRYPQKKMEEPHL